MILAITNLNFDLLVKNLVYILDFGWMLIGFFFDFLKDD